MEVIIKDVSEYVSKLLSEKLSNDFAYHNLLHTKEVTSSAYEIGSNSNLTKKELDMVLIAAWFHDTGFTVIYKGHEKESIRIAKEFLKNKNISKEDMLKIEKLIEVTELSIEPKSNIEKVMKDADILNIGKDAFFANNELIKQERQLMENKEIDEKDWLYTSMKFILETDFYTEYARKTYGSRRKENILLLSERLKQLDLKV